MLRVSLSPCRRSHPAGVDRRGSQSATAHTACACTVAGSASGAPHVRGHRCVRVRYGLETRPHPMDEAVERRQQGGVPSPCSPRSRALTFPLGGFPPPAHTSLRWTHNRTYTFQRIRLSILVLLQRPILLSVSIRLTSFQHGTKDCLPSPQRLAFDRVATSYTLADPECAGCSTYSRQTLGTMETPLPYRWLN